MAKPLPMFPLGTVLFPHAPLPLHIFEERYRALAEKLEGRGSAPLGSMRAATADRP